jgi:hypothetical protein
LPAGLPHPCNSSILHLQSTQQGCHDKQAKRGERRRRPETGSGPHHMASSLPNLPHTCPDATHAYTGHQAMRACVHEQFRDETRRPSPCFFYPTKFIGSAVRQACVIAERSPDIASLLDPR